MAKSKSLKNQTSRFVKYSNKSLKKIPGYSLGKGIGEKGVSTVYGTMYKGVNTATSVASKVGKSVKPVAEKGLSVVYGTMAKGLNLGTQGLRKISGINSKRRSRRRRSRRRH
jgi:hypothetical protein